MIIGKKTILSLLLSSMLLSVFTGCEWKDHAVSDTSNDAEKDSIENEVIEGELEETTMLKMKYDDRYVFDKEIAQIVTHSVTSKITNSDQSDECVLRIVTGTKKKKVIAVGIGTAEIAFSDGSKIQVQVEAADISMLLIIGQSNAEGQIQPDTGNLDTNTYQQAIDQSILCEEGQVYSTYAPGLSTDHGNGIGNTIFSYTLGINTFGKFVPLSLTSDMNSQGGKLAYPLNSLTSAGRGKTGVDSGIAYKWHELTGDKVWVINAAHGGSKISTWQAEDAVTDNNFWQAVKLFGACQEVLQAEIAAGHYNLKTMGYFWLQGEADMNMTADEYMDNYKKMHLALKKEL